MNEGVVPLCLPHGNTHEPEILEKRMGLNNAIRKECPPTRKSESNIWILNVSEFEWNPWITIDQNWAVHEATLCPESIPNYVEGRHPYRYQPEETPLECLMKYFGKHTGFITEWEKIAGREMPCTEKQWRRFHHELSGADITDCLDKNLAQIICEVEVYLEGEFPTLDFKKYGLDTLSKATTAYSKDASMPFVEMREAMTAYYSLFKRGFYFDIEENLKSSLIHA